MINKVLQSTHFTFSIGDIYTVKCPAPTNQFTTTLYEIHYI